MTSVPAGAWSCTRSRPSERLELIDEWLHVLPELPGSLVVPLLGLLAAVENIFPPVPADTAVALGAFLSARGAFTAWAVFWATWVGNVATAIAVYVAARRIGRPFFRGRLGQRLLKPHALGRIERLHERFGATGIFLSRFIPGVRAVVPPFAGVANLGAARTILPLTVASGLWYGGITWAAATLVRRVDQIQALVRNANRAALVLGGLALLAVGVWLARRTRGTGEDDGP